MDASLEPVFTKAFTTIAHQVCTILFKEYLKICVEGSKYSLSFPVLLVGLTIARLMILWESVGYPKTIKPVARNMEYRSHSPFLEPAVRNAS